VTNVPGGKGPAWLGAANAKMAINPMAEARDDLLAHTVAAKIRQGRLTKTEKPRITRFICSSPFVVGGNAMPCTNWASRQHQLTKLEKGS
jgi:hypothetical protein